jgi:endo-1,4-beta-xylanase
MIKSRILHPALVLALCAILCRAEPLEAAGNEAPGSESWSTNFATLGSPAGGGIETWTAGTELSIDASNVNSGGKAIRASGRVDPQHPIQAAFSVRGLVGQETADFRDKRLSLEIYVPRESPLAFLHIELSSGNDFVMARVNVPIQRGRWYDYEADIGMIDALESWSVFDWSHSRGISTPKQAEDLFAKAQYIKVTGQADYLLKKPADAYFLIDRIGWGPSEPLPDPEEAPDSLRKLAEARNLYFGGYLDPTAASDASFMGTFLREFDAGAYGVYWPELEPSGDSFDASVRNPADDLLANVAEAQKGTFFQYALGGNDNPRWLIDKKREEAGPILEKCIRGQLGPRKGATKIWYVFNEILRSDVGWKPYSGLGLKSANVGGPRTWANDYSPFSKSPSDLDMIEAGFRTAREADPEALLALNEGGVEEMGQARPDAFYKLVAKLVKDGAPIDAVGLQAHFLIGKDGKVRPNGGGDYPLAFSPAEGLRNVDKNVARYEALGLKVIFSEIDVAVWKTDIDGSPSARTRLEERLKTQAEVYRSLMRIALSHSNVAAFVIWSWADQYCWYDYDPWHRDYGYPGIYDADYRPKPAFFALFEELTKP